MEIAGLGKRRLEPVPGEDSLQALVLALQFASRVIPLEAERAGGRLQWLGERESLIFADTFMCGLLERNLENCLTALVDTVGVLEKGGAERSARRLAQRLRALIASGGYTNNPPHMPPSGKSLERPAGRSKPIR